MVSMSKVGEGSVFVSMFKVYPTIWPQLKHPLKLPKEARTRRFAFAQAFV